MLDSMESAGASPEAIAFAKSLGEESAYMFRFRDAGRVDIAYIEYPIEDTQGILLINGSPPILDIGAPEILQKVEQNAGYKELLSRNPEVRVQPPIRYQYDYPLSFSIAGGGQEFIAQYSVRGDCYSCVHVGDVLASFRFGAIGRFQGVPTLNILRNDFKVRRGDLKSVTPIRLKLGDVIHVTLEFNADVWDIEVPAEPAVIRELHRGSTGMCAGICFGTMGWMFEAIGEGETRLVFKTSPQLERFPPPIRTAEFQIQVE